MFGKLKDKLKKSLSIFSKKAEEEVEEDIFEEQTEESVEDSPKKEVKISKEEKKAESLEREEPVIEVTKEEPKKEEKPQVCEPVIDEKPKEEAIKQPAQSAKGDFSLPMSRDEAWELVKKHNSTRSDLNHYLESEAVMREVAAKLGENVEYYGMLGLVHDIDWGMTKKDPTTHLTKAPAILKEAGFDQRFIDIVLSHGYGFDCAGLINEKRTEKIQFALACSETITGLVHTYALMRGGIDGMKAKGLKKKFKDKAFAAAIDRNVIKECEHLGFELNEFFDIAIVGISRIKDQVGLGKEQETEPAAEEYKPKEEVKVESSKEEKKAESLEKEEPVIEVTKEAPVVVEEKPQEVVEEKPKKKSLFGRLKQTFTTKTISADKFEELFWDLEMVLLENNVSVEVIDKIKDDLKEELVDKPLPRDVTGKIEETLRNTLNTILSQDPVDVLERIKNKSEDPFVIAFFGVNGAGKTTSIAKLANYLKENGQSVVLAACDTFRAAAIQQLGEHAEKLGVKMISHDYGSDAAAVAFDAIKHAKKHGNDVVLIDTAGRLHSNTNLMAELEKIIRVTNPDLKIFVGESITGNDCIEQARRFNELVEMDGAMLTKVDVDEKGGAPLSISYTIKKPILFLGVGQEYKDFEKFDAQVILKRLGF